MITSKDLHDAADVVGTFSDDENRLGEYGLSLEELMEFVQGSSWAEEKGGQQVGVDPMALAMGGCHRCDRPGSDVMSPPINLYIWGVTWEDSAEWARGDAMEDVVREELMACWGSTENCLVVDVGGTIMWNTTGRQIGRVYAS